MTTKKLIGIFGNVSNLKVNLNKTKVISVETSTVDVEPFTSANEIKVLSM